MTLKEYRRKRSFRKTPEPRGGAKERPARRLRFMVHKHEASHLHYDLRLELDGILKSWAIPKGPSLNPQERRLAMMVEDHPLEYAAFEGVIPEGSYGAGTTMIWDKGTYHAWGTKDRAASEKALRDGLKKEHLTFIVEGTKLRGEFALVRLKKAREPNAWLLIKKDDEYAARGRIKNDDRSAATGRTMKEITAAASRTSPARASSSVLTRDSIPRSRRRTTNIRGAKKGPMPHGVKPMLTTLVAAPFDRSGWLFEIKWDGYRAVAEIEKGDAKLYSRNGLSFVERFPSIVNELKQLPHSAVLDGEVVVLDEHGRSEFERLQDFQRSAAGTLRYYVFDILYLDGFDLRPLPLIRRKEILKAALPELTHIKFSDHIEESGLKFFREAVKRGLEGIIAKDGQSPYRPGARGMEWQKIKARERQEAVIGGFTAPRGSRSKFGALVLGTFEDGTLTYIGHTGGGFNERSLAEVYAKLKPLIQKTSPFSPMPKTNAPATWVKPALVCEVTFENWTKDGQMRQPVFVGLREDKAARDVHRERPKSGGAEASDERKEKINGRALTLTHLSKVYFPDDGITKGDLIEYYKAIAPYLLPYLKDRPESLHRFPDGITGEGFYQKNIEHPPPWAKTVTIRSESDNKDVHYLVANDLAAVLYMVNLGCIEMNPWNSRLKHLENPDYLIVDLDPEDAGFDAVIKTASAVRGVFDRLGIKSFPKTTGARGIHILIPLAARYHYDQVRDFAELLVNSIHRTAPALTSLERRPKNRRGKVYLDYLQNSKGQTIVAPYAVKPRPGAPVSAPLRWSEVKPGLDPKQFTIQTILPRLKKHGDLFKDVLGPGINLKKTLAAMEQKKLVS